MREAKPVFNHKSMVETVANVLLNAEAELRVEDITSLLASVTEPSVRGVKRFPCFPKKNPCV
jgi:hypothetical protein